MKQLNTIPQGGQNWQWPEQTWFRQRLNTVKAEETQQRRRINVDSQRPVQAPSIDSDPADQLKAE